MRCQFLLAAFFSLLSAASVFSQPAGTLYEELRKTTEAKDWAGAERIARQGMSLYPAENGFVLNLCYSLRMQKKISEALAVIEPVYAKNTADPAFRDNYVYTLMDFGWDLAQKKDYEKAYQYFHKAWQIKPDDQWTVNAWGHILLETGEKEQSVSILKKGMKDFPENSYISGNLVASLLSLGWDRYNAKDYAGALAFFKEAHAIRPDDEWVLNALGCGFRETGDLDRAIEYLEKCHRLSPGNEYLGPNLSWAYILKANRLKESGLAKTKPDQTDMNADLAASESLFKKAGALDPDNESYLLNYGIFLNALGRFTEARVLFVKGEKLYAADEYFAGNIQYGYQQESRALAAHNDYRGAIALVTEARGRFPRETWFMIDLIDWYWKLNDYKKSAEKLIQFAAEKNLEDYRKALSYSKEELIVFRSSRLIWKYAERGDFAAGFVLLDKIEAAMPGSYFTTEQRGELTYHSGEKEKGISLVNRAYDQYIAAHPQARRSITISLPLKGIFLVYGNNRTDTVTHAGLNRFCFDFMGSDEKGDIIKPGVVFPGTKNEDYYGFGADIYSPVDGVVEEVEDSYADIAPRAIAVLGDGNRITIRDDQGNHYVFAHNKKGSALVVKGQRIIAGDKITSLGNTGYTAYPHFHFGVYTPDWRVSIEVRFSSYTVISKDGAEKPASGGIPQTGEVIRN